MATNVNNSLDILQAELDRAKNTLKGVNEHIKKLIGRDPNEGPLRPGMRRLIPPPEDFKGRSRGFGITRERREVGPHTEEEVVIKRKPGHPLIVCSRLSGPPKEKRDIDSAEEDQTEDDGEQEDKKEDDKFLKKPAISSRVFTTPKELPSRQEAISAQNNDEFSKARNRRMFGALLGTLQKFRQEETRMKDKEEKRAKVERKLEENAKREKEELKKERQELFQERKRKQAEIRNIELKMQRIKEQEEWEEKQKPLLNFIQTRAKPHIFYIPKVHNVKTEEKLASSKKTITKMIEKKHAEVHTEVGLSEKRKRRRFSSVEETVKNVTIKSSVNTVPNTINDEKDSYTLHEAIVRKAVQELQEPEQISEESKNDVDAHGGEVENTNADEETSKSTKDSDANTAASAVDLTSLMVKKERQD